MSDQDQFFSRQNLFCNHEKMQDLSVLIVGCGAIGRNVASNVARLGIKQITLVDGDIVEEHNISPQNWTRSQIGQAKVEALGKEISDQSPNIVVKPLASMWSPGTVGVKTKFDAVWSTVDNISVRGNLWNFYKTRVPMFMDVRIGGPVGQVLSVVDTAQGEWYSKTIFEKSEAANFGCVQPMSNFMANIAAGLSVNQFSNAIAGKGWPVHKMLVYNAITSLITTENPDEYFADTDSSN